MKRDLAWKAIAAALVSTALAGLGSHEYAWRNAAAAEPMRIILDGLGPQVESIDVWIADDKDQRRKIKEIQQSPAWLIHGVWVAEVSIVISAQDLARVRRVDLTIGKRRLDFSGQDFTAWKTDLLFADGRAVVRLPSSLAIPSQISTARMLLNWPGDAHYIHAVAQIALVPILLALCLIFWMSLNASSHEALRWGRHVLGLDEVAGATPSSSHASPVSLMPHVSSILCFGFLILALIFLELRQPYYFCQGDTITEIQPQMLVGCRQLWQGTFPDYNPYVMRGSPLASLGIYSLTYPPTYLAYALARHVLGDEFATADVFAILHIVAGFFVTREVGRALRMGPLAANLVALSFVLSGATLIMGRSWLNFLPLVAWLPTLFLALVMLQTRPVGWKWLLATGLACGLSFHVGFSQSAVYLVGIFCVAALFLITTGALPRERAALIVPALLLGAGLTLPLAYQQFALSGNLTQSTERPEALDEGIADGLPAMFLPYPLVEAQLPSGWGNANYEYLGHFYFFGGLLALLFVWQLAGLLIIRPVRGQWSAQLWNACALVALWLALGSKAGLWELANRIPVLTVINRHPLRLMSFVVFFMCVSGGLTLDRLLRSSGKKWMPAAITGLAMLGLGFHLVQCRSAFLTFGFRPYTPLPEEWAAVLRSDGRLTGRVQSWSRSQSPQLDYSLLLGGNMAGIHEVPTFGGENPLVQRMPQVRPVPPSLASLKAYGVRWHLSSPTDHLLPLNNVYCHYTCRAELVAMSDPFRRELQPEKLPRVAETRGVVLSELTDVDPLAFTVACACQPLRLRLHGRGLDVDIATLDSKDEVVVNFLRYPAIRTYIDGDEVPHFADNWYRIVVPLDKPGRTLSVRYEPAWATGLLWGCGTLALGLALARRCLRIAAHPPFGSSRVEGSTVS